ncbi:cytochrome P450 2K1-like isoform X1 [Brienomyrus brachyistius]|uniref:cytochrome P450 2K1-like isoform X1 n=1 Tax=Brienomyrus brachyistius TaxID=42636 RepID=UPI0020B383F8|nr:cytochrome P450 2K1-like isoform X1 [Brienomyrus brachyistius]
MAVLEGLIQVPSVITLLGAVLVFLVLYLLSSIHNKGKEPPGPRPLPFIGNLLQLDLKNLHLSFCQLSQKYGPVFTIQLGSRKSVVLAGFKAVREALADFPVEFGQRATLPIFHDLSNGHGIMFANGDSWKEMRRFALTSLRDLGMGKQEMEENIIEEIHYITEVFEHFKGKPFDVSKGLTCSISNIISSIIFGSRFDYTDPEFQEMVKTTKRIAVLLGSPGVQLYNMLPSLNWVLKDRKDLMESYRCNLFQLKKFISKLQETFNTEDRRGFVDSFLIQQQKASSKGNSAHYHNENLLFSVANLFAAGTDTTATTLHWGLLLMAKYPHIQDRVQEELDRVIGGRQTRVEDRRNLPYTDAVIHETQRLANIVPLSALNVTRSDVVFRGYHIRKGTTVIPLLTSVLYDESEWETPHTFNPGHFLDDQGRFRKRDAFMPFSAGRRVCPGESLARMELFLFFTSLLQKFHFTPPPGVSESDLNLSPVVGLTLNPYPQKLCAVNRA